MRASLPALFLLSFFINLVAPHYAEELVYPANFCNEIVGSISFPFKNKTHSPKCGLYTVDCSDHTSPKIQLKEEGYWFAFESIAQLNLVSIKDEELHRRLKSDYCNDEIFDILSLPSSSPILHVSTHNLILFKCTDDTGTLDQTSYRKQRGNAYHTYYTASNSSLSISPAPQCSIIHLPAVPDQPPFMVFLN